MGRRDQGIDRFESRSSLKTWIFRILTNTAKTRGLREGRSIPFASLAARARPGVDPERFLGDDTGFPGHWAEPPQRWEGAARLLERETLDVIERTIAELPPAQAIVITMRDVAGFDSEEVCNALEISETNRSAVAPRAFEGAAGTRGVPGMRLDRELTCAQVVELVTAYLERRLPEADTERFEEHLVFCDGCSTYLDQMRATIAPQARCVARTFPAGARRPAAATFREARSP